jgi:hypothetical protein
MLRNVPAGLMARVTERANDDGWALRAVIVHLLELYADRKVDIGKRDDR